MVEEQTIKLRVNGKRSKKSIKHYEKKPWDMVAFLLSEEVCFRERDKEIMKVGYREWWKWVIKKYGKSNWIEMIMFTRLEKK